MKTLYQCFSSALHASQAISKNGGDIINQSKNWWGHFPTEKISHFMSNIRINADKQLNTSIIPDHSFTSTP